eukprot:gene10482-12246_t
MTIGSNSVLLIAASFIFAVYVSTVSDSIAGGDSGEIVAEGCHLGTAHPPGYPLITVIIYTIANWLQHGTVAYRVNIFCSLCTTAAALLIGVMVQKLYPFKSSAGSIIAMGLFSFSPLIWQYAITSEVFPLNTVLAALILYLVVLFSQTSNINVAYFGALVCGLAFTNQHTILLYEVPLVLWMLFLLRNHIYQYPSVLVKLSAAYLVGLLPYAYLPLAALYAHKPGSWGQVDSLSGFVHHILRRDYGTFQLFSGAEGKAAEGFGERTVAFVRDFMNTQTGGHQSPHTDSTLGIVAIVLVVLGVVVGLTQIQLGHRNEKPALPATVKATPGKKGKKTESNTASSATPTKSANTVSSPSLMSTVNTVLVLNPTETSFTPTVLFFTQLFYFGVFHSLSNLPLKDRLLYGVHQRFWMQPNILMFVWLGVGVNTVLFVLSSVVDAVVGVKTSTNGSTDTESASNKKSFSVGQTIMHVLGLCAAVTAVYTQLNTWYPLMDTSRTTHFTDYATAILAPLPQNAVLLINYDQQWTSVRYRQVCEGYRPDITSIQLSMMTYAWFQHKRDLYPHLTFPGTYHTYPNSPALRTHNAFTLKQFLDANTPHVAVYLGGKLSYNDPQLNMHYEMVPVGMVSRFVPTSATGGAVTSVENVAVADDVTAERFVNNTHSGWSDVFAYLSVLTLPDPVQFPMETWEWTIGRDYRDRIADTAAYLLEKALQVESTNPLPLVEAIYWLESAYVIEQLNATQLRSIRAIHSSASAERSDNEHVMQSVQKNVRKLIASTLSEVADVEGSGAVHTPAHLLKNTGLAYVHLVRNNALAGTVMPLPQQDVLRTLETGLLAWPTTENIRLWASTRFLFFWGEFLKHPDALRDSQYPAIKTMYETATKSVRNTESDSGGSKGGKGDGQGGKGEKVKKSNKKAGKK